MTSDLEKFIDNAAAGVLPNTLAELTQQTCRLLRINAKVRQLLSIIVYCAREPYFDGNLKNWAIWCEEKLNITNQSERFHLYAVGEMLFELREHRNFSKAQYDGFFGIDFAKQLAISRIEVEYIPAFLSQLGRNVQNMTREEVRLAVNFYLDPDYQLPQSVQPELPGLEKSLDEICTLEEREIFAAVATPEISGKSIRVGGGLLQAAIDYECRAPRPNIELLNIIKTELISEIDKINQTLAEALPQ